MAEKKAKARAHKAAIEKEFAIELREYELKKQKKEMEGKHELELKKLNLNEKN